MRRCTYFFQTVGFPGGSVVKNHLPTQEIWVQSLGWKDSLEQEMATRSSLLIQKIPWTKEPGRLQSTGSQSQDMTECLSIQACRHIHVYSTISWIITLLFSSCSWILYIPNPEFFFLLYLPLDWAQSLTKVYQEVSKNTFLASMTINYTCPSVAAVSTCADLTHHGLHLVLCFHIYRFNPPWIESNDHISFGRLK